MVWRLWVRFLVVRCPATTLGKLFWVLSSH